MMELALRQKDPARKFLAGLDRCIGNLRYLDIEKLIACATDADVEFDKRTLCLAILWKHYHDQLINPVDDVGGIFWIAQIREATLQRLEVARGQSHFGYDVDSATHSGWDSRSIEEKSWVEHVEDTWLEFCSDGEFSVAGKVLWEL